MPYELILLFARDSSQHARVTAAGKGDRIDLASLEPLVEELAAAARVPLAAQRVAGGGALVVAVDVRALLARVASSLRERTGARVRDVASGTDVPGLIVEATPAKEPEINAQVERLDLPIKVQPADKGELRIEVDTDRLMADVERRLRTARGVEDVERNVLMRPMKP